MTCDESRGAATACNKGGRQDAAPRRSVGDRQVWTARPHSIEAKRTVPLGKTWEPGQEQGRYVLHLGATLMAHVRREIQIFVRLSA